MSVIVERKVTLDRPEFNKIKLFVNQVTNEIFIDNLEATFKPEKFSRILVDVRIIYNPETDKQRHHGNIEEYPYVVKNFLSFKQEFEIDMAQIFYSTKIPQKCQQICLKAIIRYET